MSYHETGNVRHREVSVFEMNNVICVITVHNIRGAR
jgi:hypothetical protein